MEEQRDLNRAAVAVFDRRADVYEQKFMNVTAYGQMLEMFVAVMPVQAHVLELACGPGNVTRHLLGLRPDLHILATDLAPAMVALAQKNNPGAECRLMDCRAIDRLTEQYDGIVCAFGLPYLCRDEVVTLIADMARKLRAGGAVYISFMEADNGLSGWQRSSAGDELFMNYHEAEYICAALEQAGFEITSQQRQLAGNGTDTDLQIVARLRRTV